MIKRTEEKDDEILTKEVTNISKIDGTAFILWLRVRLQLLKQIILPESKCKKII